MATQRNRSGETRRTALYGIQLVCALLGVALSVYLILQHTRLKSGIQDGASFCTFGSFANCDVVSSSRYSELFGIPIATIGAGFYFLLFVLGLLAPPGKKGFATTQRWMALLAVPALLVDTGLFLVQVFDLHTFCLMCLLTYVCTAIHFAMNLSLSRLRRSAGEGARSVFVAPPGEPVERPDANAFGLGLVALAAFASATALIPYYVATQSATFTMINNALAQFFAQWKEMPAKEIEVKEGDGTYGNPSSKVKIVEFSDFECPHCRKAAFTLHTFLQAMGNRVHFTFKHFPLDSACNAGMQYQLHPHACQLARLAYCAERKQKFWPFHDIIMLQISESDLKAGIDGLTDKLSTVFTRDEIVACLKDEKSLQNAREDIKTGNNLGIKGTPSLFINGKPVTIPLSIENLKRLVSIEESIK